MYYPYDTLSLVYLYYPRTFLKAFDLSSFGPGEAGQWRFLNSFPLIEFTFSPLDITR
jgi:hypothetical protein